MSQVTADLRRLKKRSQFTSAARGNRAGRPSFGLQAVACADPQPGIGYTVTKKTGNSPERSRIKRRLREAVRLCAASFVPAHDYVLVGRRDALTQPFAGLVADLATAIKRVHSPKPNSRNTRPAPTGDDRNSLP